MFYPELKFSGFFEDTDEDWVSKCESFIGKFLSYAWCHACDRIFFSQVTTCVVGFAQRAVVIGWSHGRLGGKVIPIDTTESGSEAEGGDDDCFHFIYRRARF